jgi:hypothetical protein
MSIKVLRAVFAALDSPDKRWHPAHRLALVVLANFSDDAGKSYPSIKTIATMVGLGVRQTERVLADLEGEKVLHIAQREGRARKKHGGWTTNLYTLRLDKLASEVVLGPPHGATPTSPHAGTAGVTSMSPHKAPDEVSSMSPHHEVTPMSPHDATSATVWGDIHDQYGVTPMSPEPLYEPSMNQGESRARTHAHTRARARGGDASAPAQHRASAMPLPPAVELSESGRRFCEQHRPDLDPQHLHETFVAYYTRGKGAGEKRADWDAEFERWVRREYRDNPATSKPPKEDFWTRLQRAAAERYGKAESQDDGDHAKEQPT